MIARLPYSTGQSTSYRKHLQHIVELAMEVSAYFDWRLEFEQRRLPFKYRLRLAYEPLDS